MKQKRSKLSSYAFNFVAFTYLCAIFYFTSLDFALEHFGYDKYVNTVAQDTDSQESLLDEI